MAIDLKHLNRFPDINFRFVTLDDAEFIWTLRNHEFKSRHLHPVGLTIKDQEEWLREYKVKENRDEEYYFMISDGNNTRQGLYRIYNIQPESAEVGSWIFRDGAPKFIAIKADLMLREFIFTDLDKKSLYWETRKKNKRIYRYSMLINSSLIDEDELNYYFHLSREKFKNGKEKVKKMMQIDC